MTDDESLTLDWLAPDDDCTFGASTVTRAAGLDRHPELGHADGHGGPDDASPWAGSGDPHQRLVMAGLLAIFGAWRHTGTRPSVVRPMMGAAPSAYGDHNGGAADMSGPALTLAIGGRQS
jgi:hypothetical protein